MDRIGKIGLAISIILLIAWFIIQNHQAQNRIAAQGPEDYDEIKSEGIVTPEESIPIADYDQIREEKKSEIEGVDEFFPEDASVVEINTGLISVMFNSFGGTLQKIKLKENPEAGIRKLPSEESGDVTLLATESPGGALGMILNFEPAVMEFKQSGYSIEFNGLIKDSVHIGKRYSFKEDSYIASFELWIQNNSDSDFKLNDGLKLVCGSIFPIDHNDSLGVDILFEGGIVKRENGEVEETSAKIEWLGLKTKYFSTILRPTLGNLVAYSIDGEKKKDEVVKAAIGCARGDIASPYKYLRAVVELEDRNLSAGEKLEYNFELYFGPSNYEILKRSGIHFEKILNLGLLSPISKAIIWLLGLGYNLIGSYGWAIIFMTIVVKIVLWPLTHKSYQSMKEMQKLQPEIAALREKYGKEPKKFQTAQMKLFKEHKVNPMGGCLPMLFQMPVLFALFTTLRNTILLRKASFWIIPGKWIQDLSGPDRLATLPQSYPIIGDQLNILPLLMGATFFLQQKFTPTSGGANPQSAQQQKMMSSMMPIIFTFIFYTLPSGLNLYFMLSTLITVFQQVTAKSGK